MSASSLFQIYLDLPETEKENFFLRILEERHGKMNSSDENATESRKCPRCGSYDIRRNGKQKDGKQRYKCMHCGRGFLDTLGSFGYHSGQDKEKQALIVSCFFQGKSLRTTAQICGISPSTAVRWKRRTEHALCRILGVEKGLSVSEMVKMVDVPIEELKERILAFSE